MTTQNLFSLNSFLEKTSQNDLELYWLGCIFYDTDYCRSADPDGTGLFGLDRSMFRNSIIFEMGSKLLRLQSFPGFCVFGSMKTFPEETLVHIMNAGLFSKLTAADKEDLFLPTFFKSYVEEIEKRHALNELKRGTS